MKAIAATVYDAQKHADWVENVTKNCPSILVSREEAVKFLTCNIEDYQEKAIDSFRYVWEVRWDVVLILDSIAKGNGFAYVRLCAGLQLTGIWLVCKEHDVREAIEKMLRELQHAPDLPESLAEHLDFFLKCIVGDCSTVDELGIGEDNK